MADPPLVAAAALTVLVVMRYGRLLPSMGVLKKTATVMTPVVDSSAPPHGGSSPSGCPLVLAASAPSLVVRP